MRPSRLPALALLLAVAAGCDGRGGQHRAGEVRAGVGVAAHLLQNQRLLDHVVPDVVHVLAGGRFVKSGGPELARELEQRGYDWLLEEAA